MITNSTCGPHRAANAPVAETRPAFTPRVDIVETSDAILLHADLPGVGAEDLEIQVEDRELKIHGRVSPRHGQGRLLYSEYEVGDFHRTFTVGELIQAEGITAELNQGVLTVRLPKVEAVKPRRIEIRTN